MEPQQVAVARTSIEKETGSMEQMEKVPPVERDYSGAPIMKTDPAEIALVKKLDLTILVSVVNRLGLSPANEK
jgi:hypothetical protein